MFRLFFPFFACLQSFFIWWINIVHVDILCCFKCCRTIWLRERFLFKSHSMWIFSSFVGTYIDLRWNIHSVDIINLITYYKIWLYAWLYSIKFALFLSCSNSSIMFIKLRTSFELKNLSLDTYIFSSIYYWCKWVQS